ncbi:MAG: hypothetical protein ACI4UB_01575 [Limosilactobacillus sp.]
MRKLKKILVLMQDNEQFAIPQEMVDRLYLKRFDPAIGIDGDGNLHRAMQVRELSVTVDEQLLNTIKTPSMRGGLGERGFYDAQELQLIFDTGRVVQLILPWKSPAGAATFNLDFCQYRPATGKLRLFWSDDEYQIAELQEVYR